MKKFFIIVTSLLIIGIGLPILAASNGGRYDWKKHRSENASLTPDQPHQGECKKKQEAKRAKRALEEKKAKEAAMVDQMRSEKKEGRSNSSSTSFNFLYYLFYKSSVNEFIKDADYCEHIGSDE